MWAPAPVVDSQPQDGGRIEYLGSTFTDEEYVFLHDKPLESVVINLNATEALSKFVVIMTSQMHNGMHAGQH